MICYIISGWIVSGKYGREREETQILSTGHLEVVIVGDEPRDLNRVKNRSRKVRGCLKEGRGLSSVNRVKVQQS